MAPLVATTLLSLPHMREGPLLITSAPQQYRSAAKVSNIFTDDFYSHFIDIAYAKNPKILEYGLTQPLIWKPKSHKSSEAHTCTSETSANFVDTSALVQQPN